MKKYILTVTLNPALDITACVPTPKNKQQNKAHLTAGGKGINVSRALNSLNSKSIATGFVGGNTGRTIKQLLRKENLIFDFVNTLQETRINYTFLSRKRSVAKRKFGLTPKVNVSDIERFIKKYLKLLKKSNFVVISGSSVHSPMNNLCGKLISIAHANNVPVLLDTSGRSFRNGIKASPLAIKPNKEEAEQFLGFNLNSRKKIRKALSFFRSLGVQIIFITKGSKGAIAMIGDDVFQADIEKIEAKNDVGSGDAFVAGFLCAYQKKKEAKEIFHFAVAAGLANVGNIVPGSISRNKILEMQKYIKISKFSI